MKKKIFIVNGPNLDMLGVREPQVYGTATLADIERDAAVAAKECGYEIEFLQYNGEGEIVDALHRAYREAAGVVLNAAAYTHYSYAIADAVKMLDCPTVELHISNVFARESFRHESVIAPYVTAVISGAGVYGYRLAVQCVTQKIGHAK